MGRKNQKLNREKKQVEAHEYSKQGNEAYGLGNYTEAMLLYNKSIDLDWSTASIFSDRAQVFIMLEQFNNSIGDCV